MADENILEELLADLSSFRRFRAEPALKRTLAAEKISAAMIAEQVDRSCVVSQFGYWQAFASDMIAAQTAYIGPSLGQSRDKASHSLEVGEGVAIVFASLASSIDQSVPEQELNYIRFRGHLHDGGRILDLSDEVLNKERPELIDQSAKDIALSAANGLVLKYGRELGSKDDVAQAICFSCVTNRGDTLYKQSIIANPDVQISRDYFHREDVHNPLYLTGLHNFTSHHNTSGLSPVIKENFNNATQYGVVDHLAMMIDRASACTGGATYLDEIALHMINYVENGQCDASYMHFFLNGYGTGDSLIETWHTACVEKGFNRIPGGLSKRHFDMQQFASAMRDNEDGKDQFPRFFSSWSPYPTSEAREELTDDLEHYGSVADLILEKTRDYIPLSAKRIVADFDVSYSVLSNNSRKPGVKQHQNALKP